MKGIKMANSGVKGMELICLILMLIPGLGLIGFILYMIFCDAKGIKLIIALLSCFVGFIASIFLWLDAFGVISLGGKKAA